MIARALAGTLLGFPLSAAIISLVLHALPHHGDGALMPALILLFPLWLAIIAAACAARSNQRAWTILSIATVTAFVLLWIAR